MSTKKGIIMKKKYTVLDRPKRFLAHLLRPNIIQSPNSTFGIIAHNVPPRLKGGARSKETGSNEPQRLSCTLCTFQQ